MEHCGASVQSAKSVGFWLGDVFVVDFLTLKFQQIWQIIFLIIAIRMILQVPLTFCVFWSELHELLKSFPL